MRDNTRLSKEHLKEKIYQGGNFPANRLQIRIRNNIPKTIQIDQSFSSFSLGIRFSPLLLSILFRFIFTNEIIFSEFIGNIRIPKDLTILKQEDFK